MCHAIYEAIVLDWAGAGISRSRNLSLSLSQHLTFSIGHIHSLSHVFKFPFQHSDQTGNSAFLLPPEIFCSAICIYGPTTGIFPANDAIVAKKSPKRTKMPYSSTTNPTRGQRNKMSRIPTMNAAVPLSFWRRAKKMKVFWGPMMRVRPIRKRIYTRCGILLARRREVLLGRAASRERRDGGGTDISHC